MYVAVITLTTHRITLTIVRKCAVIDECADSKARSLYTSQCTLHIYGIFNMTTAQTKNTNN